MVKAGCDDGTFASKARWFRANATSGRWQQERSYRRRSTNLPDRYDGMKGNGGVSDSGLKGDGIAAMVFFEDISCVLYTVFFYEAGESKEGDDPFGRAKEALEKVLIPWYPVAGRLNEYKPCYENLVPKLPDTTDLAETPIAVAQITSFGCGGLALGFGGSHALFDGIEAFNFLSSWAHISNGKANFQLIVPNYSRDALLSSIYSSPAHASIYEQNHITAIQDLNGIPMEDKGTALAKFNQAHPQVGLEQLTLAVRKETMEILKM
ncbi:Leucine-rich repeat protein kinase family protein [Hibiscus syriacus]|uniref:Leucine-rich repeat protein kinase family protein n=1 Tax=Hibiscus syriacus TaxID=106335 RepID=A0A6A3ALE7_HIBSY|nr:Leucine-rich repeat protein kinase family protein [Hibiscus syriacus]